MPSASELLPCPPTSPDTHGADLQVILDTLLLATEQAARWDAHKRSILDALTTFHDLGKVEDRIEHAGWTIAYSPGRRCYDYPPSVIELEAQLQEAREAAVVARTAVLKPSTPYWSVRRPKGPQEAV
jgi:hypothetical protein